MQLIAADTAPIVFTLKDSAGVAVNITGYSFALKLGYSTPVNIAGVITGVTTGTLEFRPAVGNLVAGNVPAEILVTTPDTKERTQKLGTIQILPRIV